MISNLEKYKKDLDQLIANGELLKLQMQAEFAPENHKQFIKQQGKDSADVIKYIEENPFTHSYQNWYSESLVLLKQLLPDRLNDFVKLYERPKASRKNITFENYVIEDALQCISITHSYTKEKIIGPEAAITKLVQQVNIIASIKRRFESTLFDIKQLVQSDLFDSELEAASELNKKGFERGAGAIAGVVLEEHLIQICKNHNVAIKKKDPTINDLIQALKENNIIDTPEWRRIQYLADIRNKCDHKKPEPPTKENIKELISGVEKTIKSLF